MTSLTLVRSIPRVCVLLILALLLALVPQSGHPSPVVAAALTPSACIPTCTYAVNTSNDTHEAPPLGNHVCADSSGACSLRAAIEEANADTGDDITITVPNNLGTYNLTLGITLPLTATPHSIAIYGVPNPRPTIAGNNTFPIMSVDPGANAYLDHLTITGGYGGGIDNSGGLLNVSNSLLSDNSAYEGGGIYNTGGTVTVSNSTISSNYATYEGGGIYNTGGTVKMSNSTISANTADYGGGGIYNLDGTVNISVSVLSMNKATNSGGGNGGGIYNTGVSATVDVTNSLLSDNTATSGNGGGIDNTGNMVTVTHSTLNRNTAYNGGGIYNTGTLNVLSQSYVSNNTAVVGGGIYNTGVSSKLILSSSTLSNNTATSGNGGGVFNYYGNVIVSSSTLSTNSATNGGGIYNTGVSATLNVSTGSILDNNAAISGNGGGIYNDSGTVTLACQSSTLSTNSATTGNGGIYNEGDTDSSPVMKCLDILISTNSATTGKGGGIYNTGGSLTVTASTLSGNTAQSGGGISNEGYSKTTVTASTLSGNTTSGNGGGFEGGGGIYNNGSLTVDNSTLSGNTSTNGDDGGGIFNNLGTVNMSNSTLQGNSSTDDGGGIYNGGGTVNMSNSTLSGNTAPTDDGGGISNYSGTVKLTATIVANSTGPNCLGTITEVAGSGYNLDDGTSCNFSDSNHSISSTNPNLDILKDNGGPTWTMALLPGSPAIDWVDPSNGGFCPATDERGFSRPDPDGGSNCDIGAYESSDMTSCSPSSSPPGASVQQLSSDPYTNSSSQHKTEVSSASFSCGSTIVSAFQQGRFTDGGSSNNGWATSTDAGKTWKHGSLPGTTVYATPKGKYARATDPSVAYNAKYKTWMIVSLVLDSSGTGVGVLVSLSNDGLTWTNPVPVAIAQGGQFFEQTWVTCDNQPMSKYNGYCYVEFDDNAQGKLIQMSTSTDGGKTWSTPQGTQDNASGLGGQPLVQPNGTVIVPADTATESGALAFTSTDGGLSWSSSVQIASYNKFGVQGGLRAPDLLSASIDGAGKVYVVWYDCSFEKNCSANDIVMSTSSDGKTWTKIQRIPINPVGSGADHFLAGVAVDPNTSGSTAHLALVFYFYPKANCGQSCQLEVGFISSTNGGSSWSAKSVLSPSPMKTTWLAATTQGYMVGDYMSVSFLSTGKAFPVFVLATAPNGGKLNAAIYTVQGGLS